MSYRTRQQEAVRRMMVEAGRPLTAREIHRGAARWAPGLGQATVYRCLGRLVEAGEVRAVEVPGAAPHYEAAGRGHHHFFLCRDCERMFDLEGCAEGLRAMVPRGFRMQAHEIVVYGACRDCAKEPASPPARRRLPRSPRP